MYRFGAAISKRNRKEGVGKTKIFYGQAMVTGMPKGGIKHLPGGPPGMLGQT
jgi:hypothetical protein